jgi:predicted HicB family RNase H-like nuclease
MVLNRRPERQRSGRGSAADAVQEDVLREETRQLNVALPVELHQRLKVAAVQEGISVREWTARAVLYYFANADE